jgi:hypothetical protein
MLNFIYYWNNRTNTAGSILINTFDNASFVYITLNIIMAQSGSYLETQTVVGTTSYWASNGWQANQTSAKFIWGSATTDAYIMPVYSTVWTTITAGAFTTQTRYYANVTIQTFAGTGTYQITVYTSNKIYFDNIKIQIVMIAKKVGSD